MISKRVKIKPVGPTDSDFKPFQEDAKKYESRMSAKGKDYIGSWAFENPCR